MSKLVTCLKQNIFPVSEAGFSQRERLSLQKCEDELSQKFQNQIEQQRKDWQEENRKNLEKVPSIHYVVTFRRKGGRVIKSQFLE